MTNTTSTAGKRTVRLGGLALIAAGMAGDTVLAARLLTTGSVWPLLFHIPAVAVWAAGWNLVRNAGARPDVTVPVLALALFPGLGPIGLTLGLLGGWIMVRRTGVALPNLDRKVPPATTPSRPERLSARAGHSSIDSANTTAEKLASIRRARANGSGEAAFFVRRHLRDSDPDVRNEAAVTLSRLDACMDGRIGEARSIVLLHKNGAKPYTDLADLCLAYAYSGLVDPINARFYLLEARGALREALRREPERTDLSRRLAEVEKALDGSRR